MCVDGMAEHPGHTLDQMQLYLLLPQMLRILVLVSVEVDDWALGGRGVEHSPGSEELLVRLQVGRRWRSGGR